MSASISSRLSRPGRNRSYKNYRASSSRASKRRRNPLGTFFRAIVLEGLGVLILLVLLFQLRGDGETANRILTQDGPVIEQISNWLDWSQGNLGNSG